MKIVDVKACTAVVPLEVPVQFATRVVTSRQFTLVRVALDNGVEGFGYCYVGNKAGVLGAIAVRELLRDSVVGQDSTSTERIWDAMYRDSLLQGRQGLILRVMSAIDNALWDANARAAGLPLYRYLGTYHEGTVPTYASGGYYQRSTAPSDLAREVEGYAEMGFRAVKVKVGRLSAEEDAKRLDAARKAVGPDVAIFLDANNAWRDAHTAIRAIRMFERYDPGWIEEPTMPDEVEMTAEIARSISIPVATGEIENGRWGFKRLLEKKAASILQPDIGVCGGVTEFRKIASLAGAHGVPITPHSRHESAVHMVASTPNAIWLEYFPDQTITNAERLFSTRLEIKNGEAVIPDRPGFGIELDEEAVERFSVDEWA